MYRRSQTCYIATQKFSFKCKTLYLDLIRKYSSESDNNPCNIFAITLNIYYQFYHPHIYVTLRDRQENTC